MTRGFWDKRRGSDSLCLSPVRYPKTGKTWHVQPRLEREDHAGFDGCVVVKVEEWMLVPLESERVPSVVTHQSTQTQIVYNKARDFGFNLAAQTPWTEREATMPVSGFAR